MADTTFVDNSTLVVAAWLNDVNTAVYKTVINLKSDPYSAALNGTTDDYSAVQAAVTAAQAAGGGIITAPPGSIITLSADVLITASNIMFYLPNCTVRPTGSASVNCLNFGSTSGSVGTPVLSVSAAAYATSITVSSLGGLVAGSWLRFTKDAPNNGGAGRVYTFITQVRSVSGAGPYTITLASALPVAFNLADSGLALARLSMLNNCGVVGPVNFDGTVSTGTTVHGIKALYLTNSKFKGINGTGFDTGAVLWAQYGYGNLFEDCYADTSGNASYDALFYVDQTSSQINNQRAINGTGFSIQIAGCVYCEGNNLVAEGTRAGRGVKFAAALFNTFSNIIGCYSEYNGLGVSIGSCYNSFTNIVALSNTTSEGVWLSDQYNTNNLFTNAQAFGNGSRDLYVGITDTSNTFVGGNIGVFSLNNSTSKFIGINGKLLAGGPTGSTLYTIANPTANGKALLVSNQAGDGSEAWIGADNDSTHMWINSNALTTLSVNNTARLEITGTSTSSNNTIVPKTTGGFNLGSSSLVWNNLYINRLEMDFLRTSTSYANDAAAAAGGVPVGEIYRNGSVLQVRVV